jgi:hypothetical protein
MKTINHASRPKLSAGEAKLNSVAFDLALNKELRSSFIADPSAYLRSNDVEVESGELATTGTCNRTSEIGVATLFLAVGAVAVYAAAVVVVWGVYYVAATVTVSVTSGFNGMPANDFSEHTNFVC